MSATIVNLARQRAKGSEPRIAIYPLGDGVEVALEPPSARRGVIGGMFGHFRQARRHALAMAILERRPVVVVWGYGPPQQIPHPLGPR